MAPADIREAQVIKHDRAFFLSDAFGDVPKGNQAALGLYFRDTRFLSRLELRVGDLAPLLLHSSTERNYAHAIELGYPLTTGPERASVRENLSLSRLRVLDGSLVEELRVSSFSSEECVIRVTLDFDADFLDVFEVRGFRRGRRGRVESPVVRRDEVMHRYVGADGVIRTTEIRLAPAPAELTPTQAAFELRVPPRGEARARIEVIPTVWQGGAARGPVVRAAGSAGPRGYEDACARMERVYDDWRARCTRFRASNAHLQRFLDRAVLDLRMLLSTDDRGVEYLDAGVPWFSALFGRDSIITAYECLGVEPDLAWGVLRGLAARQGTREDERRGEEPGKILHEIRVGELAGTGEIPHTPYFGSIDATPLWLVLLSSAHAWTGDLDGVRELWPHALAALEWIDRYGDRDGDGYVEYASGERGGLWNQGWKDSDDAVVHADGTVATGPIALAEVQGYVYQAKTGMARLAVFLGERELAARLIRQAEDLKRRFNRDFWVRERRYVALALDRDKRQIASVTSNPGHCLWSQILDGRRARAVAARLVSPALSSGWGVRTLAADEPAFDPLAYHRGTVWPHDNALIAHGLKRSGLDAHATGVLEQLVRAGDHFPLARFPELYCGFSAERVSVPVEFPVACRPQAWASGAPLLMLRTFTGLAADAASGTLSIVRPRLPVWLGSIDVLGMRVGAARVDLRFVSQGGVTATQVLRKDGDVEIVIRH